MPQELPFAALPAATHVGPDAQAMVILWQEPASLQSVPTAQGVAESPESPTAPSFIGAGASASGPAPSASAERASASLDDTLASGEDASGVEVSTELSPGEASGAPDSALPSSESSWMPKIPAHPTRLAPSTMRPTA